MRANVIVMHIMYQCISYHDKVEIVWIKAHQSMIISLRKKKSVIEGCITMRSVQNPEQT